MNVLGEEELNFLVGKLAQLGAEHIMDADVFCIAAVMSRVSEGQRSGTCGREASIRRSGGTQRWLSLGCRGCKGAEELTTSRRR